MIILFCFLTFTKRYVVGTHYNQLDGKILICNHSNSFYEEISKQNSDSFYCMSFLLGNRFTKDSPTQQERKKQLAITFCEEIIQGDLQED